MIRANVKAADLAGALRDGVAKATGILPTLQHALVESVDEGLRITTTDIETIVRTVIPAEVKTGGAICAHAGLLKAATASGAELALEAEDRAESIIVKRGPRARVKVPALPVDVWPVFDTFEWKPAAVAWQDLATAIDVCEYAASRKDIRPFCTAVCISRDYIACTDGGARVAFMAVAYDGRDMMIPIRSAGLVRKYLGPGCELEVGFVGGEPFQVRVKSGTDVVQVKLFSPQAIPNLPAVLPTTPPRAAAKFERTALRAAVARLLPFVTPRDSKTGALPLVRIVSGDGFVRFESRDGENSDEAAIVETSGDLGGGINLSLLADTLDAIDTDVVTLAQFGEATARDMRFVVTADGHVAKHIITGATL